MPELRHSLRDTLAGAIFVAFGAAFAIGAAQHDVGTPLRMGPGYFPLTLGIILVGLGVAVIAKGVIAGAGEPIGDVEWRAMALLTAAVLFFGLTVRGLGVAGALLGATLLAALARSRTRPPEAVAIAAGLTVLSIVIFIAVLQLRLPLVGPWLPF